MPEKYGAAPDDTAIRVALWRALHVEVDAPPHILEDVVGLKLAAPDEGWRSRPDVSPFTRSFRASVVARDAGLREVQHVSADTFAERYCAGRADGLRPSPNSEELLVANT